MTSSTWATGLPIPGPLNSGTDQFSGKSSTLAFLLWGHQWSGKKLLFHCDNQAVVDIWASGTSRTPLLCILFVWYSLAPPPTATQFSSLILLAVILYCWFPVSSPDISVPPPRHNSRLAPNSGSCVNSDSLTHRLAFLESLAIADSTRRSYQAGIRRYSNFCASMRWQSYPATETTLSFFAAYLADQVSFKTIKLYLAVICFAHTENSLPDPFQEAPPPLAWCQAHRGPRFASAALTITMTLLRQIKEELARAPDFLPSDKLMLWWAFTLAFYGFLRSSEFTSPSTTQFNRLVHLCFIDVSFTSEGCLTLHLKSSKTDPYRQGCSLLIAPSLRSVCAFVSPREVPLCIPSVVHPHSTSSCLGPTSPEPKSP